MGKQAARRILFCNRSFYLDDTNGAAVASRALAECLSRRSFVIEALCGTLVDAGPEQDLVEYLKERRHPFQVGGEEAGVEPPHLRLDVGGVPVTVHRLPLRPCHEPDEVETDQFLRLLDGALLRHRPEVLITYGGDRLTCEVSRRARSQGIAVVFMLHSFLYRHPGPFADVDAVLVASQFSAQFHRAALGLDCTILPNPVDWRRVQAERPDPRYVTFVNPSPEKGVYVFARIADELGRRRPDISLLVVEGQGTEATLVGCGLDLKDRGNVYLMSPTTDPRDFWGVTKVALVPSLGWEDQPSVAIEAMINGIPVIASDRGGLPETLGKSGMVLSLPDRFTPATRLLPTAEEVAPWVEAIIKLWDDEGLQSEHRRSALAEAKRWRPDEVETQYSHFFEDLRPDRSVTGVGREVWSRWVVLVPFLHSIEFECEESLRRLEGSGVTVVRCRGSSAIDVARNTLTSEALHRGCEAILFIDADIGFEPMDALRLLARPEPVIAGVYAKKRAQKLASSFPPEIHEATFGPNIPGLYPLEYSAAGFLRIRTEVLRRMINELRLPLCNTEWGRGVWPFFLPMVVLKEGHSHYLSEDWAFCHRLHQIGVTPMADTSIRLFHIGSYHFTWEDVGSPPVRYEHYTCRFNLPK